MDRTEIEGRGALTLGRQYDLILDFVTPLGASGPGWGGNLAVHPYDNDDSNRNIRINNAVKYTSPTYCGWTLGAMYGFSNTAGPFGNNAAWSAGLSYANGPLKLGAGYLRINRNPNAANANGALSTTDGSATITGGSQQIWAVAGRYAFGPHSIGAAWSHSATDRVSGVLQGGSIAKLDGNSLVFDNFTLDGRYVVTPRLSLAAAYYVHDGPLRRALGRNPSEVESHGRASRLRVLDPHGRVSRGRLSARERRQRHSGVQRDDLDADAVRERQSGRCRAGAAASVLGDARQARAAGRLGAALRRRRWNDRPDAGCRFAMGRSIHGGEARRRLQPACKRYRRRCS
ncbi:hypothetical protein NCM_04070 [Burkholderia pseudomallei]